MVVVDELDLWLQAEEDWVNRETQLLWATRRPGFDAELGALFRGVGLEVTDVDSFGWGNTVALTVVPVV